MKYCLVINGPGYFAPFDHLGLELTTDPAILDEDPDSVGLVVFTGGEDVSPEYYGHLNYASYCNERRDREEVAIFNRARELNKPMAGICRGAQFLCAMAGGHLVQDISNHGRYHHLQFIDDDGIEKTSPETVSSTHHQMQFPWPIGEDNFEILAWSPAAMSDHYLYDGANIPRVAAPDKFTVEPDVVFYKNINALGMQYHPEWMPRDSWGFRFAQKMVSEKLAHLIESTCGLEACKDFGICPGEC